MIATACKPGHKIPGHKVRSHQRMLARIGNRIHTTRTRQGWSAFGLARRVGTYASTILRIENAETTANIHLLSKIANQLGLNLDDLCGMKKSKKRN